MNKKFQHEKDYESDLSIDCPYCSKDYPDHSCRECHTGITKEFCWRLDGCCEKCFDYIQNEIPKIENEKQLLGVKCKCVDSQCAKCLSVGCQEENCPTHTKDKKMISRKKTIKEVEVSNSDGVNPWKELTKNLYEYGSSNPTFSKVSWGNNCIRFHIPDSSFWITCYSVHFESTEKRRYGVFLSYSGNFEYEKMKLGDAQKISALESLILRNSNDLKKHLPWLNLNKASIIDSLHIVRNASEFASDKDAVEWMRRNVDEFADFLMPLIRQIV